MREEKFLSGYCRQLDASRMVELELEGRELQDVDCQYSACKFRQSCPIAEAIRELTEE